jgi:hypothetical protein
MPRPKKKKRFCIKWDFLQKRRSGAQRGHSKKLGTFLFRANGFFGEHSPAKRHAPVPLLQQLAAERTGQRRALAV